MMQKKQGVTHYFLETLYCSKRRIHHQLRQTVNESLGFRPNKRREGVKQLCQPSFRFTYRPSSPNKSDGQGVFDTCASQ